MKMASTSVGATTSAESLAHRVKKYKARTFEQVEMLKASKVDNFVCVGAVGWVIRGSSFASICTWESGGVRASHRCQFSVE